tara:strand:+ start:351 stop:512 length:162 start_codon:yes stop_codon:yes gene_type:complete
MEVLLIPNYAMTISQAVDPNLMGSSRIWKSLHPSRLFTLLFDLEIRAAGLAVS